MPLGKRLGTERNHHHEEDQLGQQLKDGLGQAWNLVATFVPKFVGFLIILLIGWLIAKAVSKALSMILGRLGFSALIEKTGLTGMLKQSNVDATGIISKLVYYFILLIALQLAFGIIAALGQIDIATAVTTPVLVTVLATVGGVIVVGFGGGLIKPAQQRWGGWMASMQDQLGTGDRAAQGRECFAGY